MCKIGDSRGFVNNSRVFTGRFEDLGVFREKRVIPDFVTGDGLYEVKDANEVYLSSQIRAEIAVAKKLGLKFHLVIANRTKVFGPLERAIESAGGVIEKL